MVSGSGPMHPDDDLLADLIADVLPIDQARAIESHVMECQECTSMLADAEHVRALLVRSDPGPIPADMLTRLESALRFEAEGHGAPQTGVLVGGAVPPAAPIQAPTTWSDTESFETFHSVMDRRSAAQEPEDDEPFPVALSAPAASGPPPDSGRRGRGQGGLGGRLHRPSRGPSRSRRDARQEVRDIRSNRRGTLLAAVAGVVIVLGLGTFAVRGFISSSGGNSTQTAADETSLNRSGSGSRVVTTGTAYTNAELAEQAQVLMTTVAREGAGGAGELTATGEAGNTAGAAVPSESQSPKARATGNLSLRDPKQLQGCLQALHAGSKEPVAVDLATYDGQEAAVIVLIGEGGGYEVWVVARTCQAGQDGTLRFLQLPS